LRAAGSHVKVLRTGSRLGSARPSCLLLRLWRNGWPLGAGDDRVHRSRGRLGGLRAFADDLVRAHPFFRGDTLSLHRCAGRARRGNQGARGARSSVVGTRPSGPPRAPARRFVSERARRRQLLCRGLSLAALISLSRVYLGAHFPSDVVCGALLGSLVGAFGAGRYAAVAPPPFDDSLTRSVDSARTSSNRGRFASLQSGRLERRAKKS
jgi:hypothetical protein